MIPSRWFVKASLCCLFLLYFYSPTQGLVCYSCWKLDCTEEHEACYEMRHFPSANKRNREISRRWRTSPECPVDGNDLRWSKSYIQTCSEEETSCGTYLIQVTASISKNSINEAEYPILVAPNYYKGTIIALGCVPVIENLTDIDNSTSISLNVPPYHVVGNNDTSQNITEIHMAPHVNRNDKTQAKNVSISDVTSSKTGTIVVPTSNVGRSDAMVNNTGTSDETAMSIGTNDATAINIGNSNSNSSNIGKSDIHASNASISDATTINNTVKANNSNVSIPTNSTAANTSQIESTTSLSINQSQPVANKDGSAEATAGSVTPEASSVKTPTTRSPLSDWELIAAAVKPLKPSKNAPRSAPEALPQAMPFVGYDPLEAIVPIMTYSLESVLDEMCKEPLSHFESRESYGTLTRINMTGKFHTCKSCSEDLCNVFIPIDDTAESPTDDDDNTIEGSSTGTLITLNHLLVLGIATLVTRIKTIW